MKQSRLLLFGIGIFLTACSTDYLSYQGGQVMQGFGGAAKNVDGVEIWVDGTPPRKFKIIGVISDSRPGGPLYMAARKHAIAKMVKQHAGDAAIVVGDERQFAGMLSSGSSYTSVSGAVYPTGYGASVSGSGTTFGTGSSVAVYRAHSKYYVIKYM